METTAFPNPDAFTNVEAQDFAFQWRSHGDETIDNVLNQKARSDAHAKRVIAACETVAAANGHPPAETGWCTSIEEWPFESNYAPEYLLFDDVPHATVASNRPRYKAVAGCAAELANLPALGTFITIRLCFDDNLLSGVCQNPGCPSLR